LPSSRSACFIQVEIDCAVGSNSRANSSGRASRSHQIDHLSPELRRISGPVTRHQTPSKINFKRVYQTGSTQELSAARRRDTPLQNSRNRLFAKINRIRHCYLC
jgi:hypothetical protein